MTLPPWLFEYDRSSRYLRVNLFFTCLMQFRFQNPLHILSSTVVQRRKQTWGYHHTLYQNGETYAKALCHWRRYFKSRQGSPKLQAPLIVAMEFLPNVTRPHVTMWQHLQRADAERVPFEVIDVSIRNNMVRWWLDNHETAPEYLVRQVPSILGLEGGQRIPVLNEDDQWTEVPKNTTKGTRRKSKQRRVMPVHNNSTPSPSNKYSPSSKNS